MTVSLYGLSNAVNQGNMINNEVQQKNINTTLQNNAINDKIADVKRDTSEQQAETGGFDVFREGIVTSNLVSRAKDYLDAANKIGQSVSQVADAAKSTAAAASDALSSTAAAATDAASAVTGTDIAAAADTSLDAVSSEGGKIADDAVTAAGGMGTKLAGGLLKGAGLIGDGATIASDVEADLSGQFGKMDFEQKVGNIGGIAGSALDIIGTAVPSLAILSVVGTGISALSGAIGGLGDQKAESTAGTTQEQTLANNKTALTQATSNAGNTPIAV
jgi:hypothetical protein